jgi:hypothetical protein
LGNHPRRRLAFFPFRIEEETRCGVETGGPPPERPGGRASAERKFFLGFSGWSDVKKAGEVVENLGRAVLDMGRVPPSGGQC